MKSYKLELTDRYKVGDLILLTASDIIYSYDMQDCDCAPGTPTRFGFSADAEGTPAIITGIKNDPEYGCEITFLIGMNYYYMNPVGIYGLPELHLLTQEEEIKAC